MHEIKNDMRYPVRVLVQWPSGPTRPGSACAGSKAVEADHVNRLIEVEHQLNSQAGGPAASTVAAKGCTMALVTMPGAQPAAEGLAPPREKNSSRGRAAARPALAPARG